MNQLFVVAAGGSGAKNVEALIHLCAAGTGPEQLDILLFDVDNSNGNVLRCRETIALYQKLQKASWLLSPKAAIKGSQVPLHGTRLFKTDIVLHFSLDPIKTVGSGGLQTHLLNEPGAPAILNLLFDESEQSSKCEHGFLARPNLGSLILGGHFRSRLADSSGDAFVFRKRLLEAANVASSTARVPLVITGSVFGGTGASLFPVACQSIKDEVFGTKDAHHWQNVSPIAVAMLPYFSPKAQQDGMVDPSRFLADAASTLEHYGRTQAPQGYSGIYFIGSDNPTRNQIEYVEGSVGQANPSLIEEFVAAQAILHAAKTGRQHTQSAWVVNPPGGSIGWHNLPFPKLDASRLALLLHLAAFTLLEARNGQPLSGGVLYATENWGPELELLPLFKNILDEWARSADELNSKYGNPEGYGEAWSKLSDENALGDAAIPHLKEPITEYFYRLLLWARTALSTPGEEPLIRMKTGVEYTVIWEVMCSISAVEIEDPQAHGDNALVRLLKTAACALAKVATSQAPAKGLVNSAQGTYVLPGFPGQGKEDGAGLVSFQIPVEANGLQALGKQRKIKKDAYDAYTRTSTDKHG